MPLASARFPTETEAATAPDLRRANGRHSPNRGCHEVTGVKKRSCHEKSPRSRMTSRTLKFVAATYSPTWWGSTIGDGELNFSVRNGKRWILTAITATIYVLRKNNSIVITQSLRCRFLALFLAYPSYSSHEPRQSRGRLNRKATQRKMSGY